MEISGAASSRLYSTSSRRPEPIQSVSPLPQSFSPSTLIRFSTRSLTAWDSIESSLSVVKVAHSGFWPVSSVLRYEIRYFGIGDHLLSVLVSPCSTQPSPRGFATQLEL